jgi:hypothetical protein
LTLASAAYVYAILAVAGVSAGLNLAGNTALLIAAFVLPILSGLSLFRARAASLVALPLTGLLALWAVPIGLVALFGGLIVFGGLLLGAAASSLTVTLRGLRGERQQISLPLPLGLLLAAIPVLAVPWCGYALWH